MISMKSSKNKLNSKKSWFFKLMLNADEVCIDGWRGQMEHAIANDAVRISMGRRQGQ